MPCPVVCFGWLFHHVFGDVYAFAVLELSVVHKDVARIAFVVDFVKDFIVFVFLIAVVLCKFVRYTLFPVGKCFLDKTTAALCRLVVSVEHSDLQFRLAVYDLRADN